MLSPMSKAQSALERVRRMWRFCTTPTFLFFLALFGSFLNMGMILAVIGPSLLELGEQVGAGLDSLVYIFSSRSVGFFLGTIVGGDLVDRFRDHGRVVLAASLIAAMFLTFLVPLVPWLGFLVLICLAQGIVLGIVDNIAQVLLLREIPEGSQPYMQALHAAFGVGGFCAPIILAPFLGGELFGPDPTESGGAGGGAPRNGTAADGGVTPSSGRPSSAVGSDSYHYAYFAICAFCLPVCAALVYFAREEVSWPAVRQWTLHQWARLRGRASGGAWASVGGSDDSNAGMSSSPVDADELQPDATDAAAYADEQLDDKQRDDSESPPSASKAQTSRHHGIEMVPFTPEHVPAHDEDELEERKLNGGAHGDSSEVFRPDEAGEHAPAHAHSHSARRASQASLLGHSIAAPAMAGAVTLAETDSPSPSPEPSSLSPLSDEDNLSPSPSPSSNDSLRASTSPSSSAAVSDESSSGVDWGKWRMVLLLSLFLLLYVGCESGYAAFIFTYAVDQVQFNAPDAALLTAVFWFAFATGRLLGIPISLRFSAVSMIFSDLLGCVLSVLLLILFHDSSTVLWVGTAFYGLSVASIYPSAIVYAEQHFAVTGKILSVMVVAASLGDAIMPLLMGLSFSSPTGPLGLMLITAAVAVSAALIFAVIVGFVAPAKGRNEAGADGVAAADAEAAERERKARRRNRKKKAAAAAAAAAAASKSHGAAGNGSAYDEAALEEVSLEDIDVDQPHVAAVAAAVAARRPYGADDAELALDGPDPPSRFDTGADASWEAQDALERELAQAEREFDEAALELEMGGADAPPVLPVQLPSRSSPAHSSGSDASPRPTADDPLPLRSPIKAAIPRHPAPPGVALATPPEL